MKLDILVIAAHPDDAELGCGGTIAKHVSLGHTVGIVDLTRGELGTRGTGQTRAEEATESARILGVSVRENLQLRDGFFLNDEHHQLKLIEAIRHYRPEIVLANAIHDRHPDHGQGAQLAAKSCFLSGLAKIKTRRGGEEQKAWRPQHVYHYIQSALIVPDFVVDISAHWETKMDAVKAFKTQFFDPSSQEPETFISKPGFLAFLEARGKEFGQSIEVAFAEGFTTSRRLGVDDLFKLR
ncbi:MAG: bacillithiol biosynthesis deacetylase BshB1 [Cytophagales bacterium]|jgi:bacillithiol biosynthesis deacetylase BshB1|nr:bacillithiol biosynthesis deacetylase BshB1 [Cytophagales bacterium]MCA6390648.1 bacillithiol biosynthesis deacetylase BshB1 [Cytophagales bacterium]MCA6396797.1 bacillithiol biosynthesis deacetylase BshB1 [Cytophagales bacterium]MCA6403310.1 bacillithiol biosynthesis deacetylase BshB1 [Cytophagales bacterium]MCA6407254.1 bacillithiol biosynthesis deacetylase BshB1 [Cytophagales bacterium]